MDEDAPELIDREEVLGPVRVDPGETRRGVLVGRAVLPGQHAVTHDIFASVAIAIEEA